MVAQGYRTNDNWNENFTLFMQTPMRWYMHHTLLISIPFDRRSNFVVVYKFCYLQIIIFKNMSIFHSWTIKKHRTLHCGCQRSDKSSTGNLETINVWLLSFIIIDKLLPLNNQFILMMLIFSRVQTFPTTLNERLMIDIDCLHLSWLVKMN